MRLGAFTRPFPDFKNYCENKQQILEHQVFLPEISNAKFGDIFWNIKHKNEEKTFHFRIREVELEQVFVLLWKKLFLISIVQENASFNTAKKIYFSFSYLIRFLKKISDESKTLLPSFGAEQYKNWIEAQGGSCGYKESKMEALFRWDEYQGFLIPELRPAVGEIPKFRFNDDPKKKASADFRGYEPFNFRDYARIVALADYLIQKYGLRFVEIFQGRGKTERFLELLKDEKLLRFNSKKLSPEYFIGVLQGACGALILSACPMRHKELLDLRVGDFFFNPQNQYSFLLANVEKTGQGLYKMPLHNVYAGAIEVLKKIQGNQDKRNLFYSPPQNEQNARVNMSKGILHRLELFGKIIGLETKINPHRFRTTCARFFLYSKKMEGVYLFKKLVGHRQISMTLNHYAKLGLSEWAEIYSRLYEQILRGMDKKQEDKEDFNGFSTRIELPFCSLLVAQNSPILFNDELMMLAGMKQNQNQSLVQMLDGMEVKNG